MKVPLIMAAALGALILPATARADSADAFSPSQSARELPPYLQCVPYARERSGVQIYGDAHTWWDQAAGRYARGSTPRPGAVMAFRPSGSMVLGHVAAVARVVDSRTVMLDHANWSPIGGRRGQIERGVVAVDVSPANDWSEVRVWYDPIRGLGTTAWPVAGFIYNDRSGRDALGGARVMATAREARPVTPKPSRAFADAFAGLNDTPTPPNARSAAPVRVARAARVQRPVTAAPRDPLDAVVARYNP